MHTPEPWKLRGNEIGKAIVSDDQNHGMMVSIAFVDKYDFEDVWEVNARRIVACVNACAGIPDSVLAVFTQPECNILVSNGLANQQLQKVEAQRDELLAALKCILLHPESLAAITRAASAIAKCEKP